jgi:putative (di)nucleoside polyphosphate hydrolase
MDQAQEQKPDYLYRSGIGIMLINERKQIFVGKRIDNHSDAWQMPQGGIDAGESEDQAMLRELGEETGIGEGSIKLLAKSAGHFYYNLPYKLQKKFWGGKYLGQKQRWYLAQFISQPPTQNFRPGNGFRRKKFWARLLLLSVRFTATSSKNLNSFCKRFTKGNFARN